MLARAGDAHVEQAPLLLDGGLSLGQGDRQQALTDAGEDDGVPLQTLGGVQGGQGDALDGGGVLGVGALTQLGVEGVEVGAAGLGHLVGQGHQGVEGVPALAHGSAGGGRLLAPALPGQDGARVLAEVAGEGGLLGAGGPQDDRHGTLDLLTLEEALAAAHEVADLGSRQGLLEDLGLGVGAVQDRDLAQGDPGGLQAAHLGDGALGLGDVVVVGLEAHGGAAGPLGDQLDGACGQVQAAAPAPRAGEDPVGQGDDLRGGAVVAAQAHGARALVAGGEAGEERWGGAGEGVDGLGDVPDDAQLAAPSQPQVQQALLERGDVLVLVDDEVLVLAAHLGGDVLAVQEDPDGQQEHVLEVDDAALALGLLVEGQDLGDRGRLLPGHAGAAGGDGGLGVVLGQGHGDLGPLDLGGQVPHGGPVGGQAQAAGGGTDQGRLVGLDVGAASADGGGPEVGELAQGGGVEGAGLDAGDAEVGQARAHLAGGAGGEGHGQDLGGLVGAGGHAVGDAVGDGPGLAGAGAGQDAQGAFEVLGDLALVGVEGLQEPGCVEGGGVGGGRAHRDQPAMRR